MAKQQTAVDFLMEKLKFINKEAYGELFNDWYDEGNLMHKEQIINAANAIDKYPAARPDRMTFGEEYYNETYKK